jgi:hypothetical protein
MRLILLPILLVSILVLPCTAASQAKSLLGMCNKTWDCSKTIKSFNGSSTLSFGWLENSFGEQCPCVDTLLKDARKKVVRIHLLNSPCMRNRRCGKYEVLWRETASSASRKIMKHDKRFMERFNKVLERAAVRLESTKDVKCYVSPCLECDLYENARRVLLNRVSNRLPNCVVVDNPHEQRCIPGTVCEQHGENPIVSKPCIVDLDGIDGSTINISRWLNKYRGCDMRFVWYPWMNCISGRFTDPRQRKCI